MSPAAITPVVPRKNHEPENHNKRVVAPKPYVGTQKTLDKRELTATQFISGAQGDQGEYPKLFWLTKTDQDNAGRWGIVHHVPLMMLYVVTGNDRGVYLTSDKDGKERVDQEVALGGLLTGDKYYCWGSDGMYSRRTCHFMLANCSTDTELTITVDGWEFSTITGRRDLFGLGETWM